MQDVGHAPVFTAKRLGSWDDSLVFFDAGQQRPLDSAGGRTSPSSTLRFSLQDLEQSNYEREQYRGYWNDTFDESVTLQMEPDKYNQRVEEARAADQQSIRRAKGLFGHGVGRDGRLP